MTEIEELKAQIEALSEKILQLEEAEKAPPLKMELIKEGGVYCVDYNNTMYYRNNYRHSNGWVKWWRENDDGTQLTRVDDAETFRLLEQLFSCDIAANPESSLKFQFGPTPVSYPPLTLPTIFPVLDSYLLLFLLQNHTH